MSEVKWKKGPWRKFNIDLKNRRLHQIVGPAVIKNEISEDDCNLIAAAPELYEASEWLLDSFLLLLSGSPVRDADEVVALAERVLAKARGESSD